MAAVARPRNPELIHSRCEVDSETGCWNWTGSVNKANRRAVYNSKYAYRISYEIFVGPIPDGLQINHHCDNGICVNPEHIYAGTHQDNINDMYRRGRGFIPDPPRGENHHLGHADAVVQAARQRCAEGLMTKAEIAAEFGVTVSAVKQWAAGKTRGLEPIQMRDERFAPRPPCGTRAGYCAHLKRKEPRCEPCLQANRQYMSAYKTKRHTAYRIGAVA